MRKTTFVLLVIILFCIYNVFAAGGSSVATEPLPEQLGIDTMASISISLVNQDPDPVFVGDVVELRLGVTNVGGQAAENVVLQIVPNYPFELISDDQGIIKVGALQAYQGSYTINKQDVKIVKYRVKVKKEVSAGSYELKVKYYEEGSKQIATQGVSIAVKSSESAEVIHIDKTMLVPGKQSSLRFRITNVGNAPLRDLSFNWENPEGIILPVGSDNTRYIKYIEMGEFADIDYQVIADTNAKAGLYKLNLHLSYSDENANSAASPIKGINTLAGVYVGGGTDFEVAFAESTNGATSFSIANIGSNPASSVSVKILEQKGWKVTGSNSVIIGNLNKGDYTLATFKIQQATTIPAQDTSSSGAKRFAQRTSNETVSSLNVLISYTDTMGERRDFEKEVKIEPGTITSASLTTTTTTNGRTATTQTSFFSQYKWYLLVVILIGVGYFVNNRYKKKKKLNPNFKFKDLFK